MLLPPRQEARQEVADLRSSRRETGRAAHQSVLAGEAGVSATVMAMAGLTLAVEVFQPLMPGTGGSLRQKTHLTARPRPPRPPLQGSRPQPPGPRQRLEAYWGA